LCDRVAILRKGKLAATGNLDELLMQHGETQAFEINVKGVSAESLRESITYISGADVISKPSGANIQISDENDVEKILQITKKLGGKLVSVQPVKQSLEELFVEKTEK